MSSFEAAFERICRDFDRLELPWALVGALAVAARAEARATLDVDIAVAVEDASEAAEVTARLRALGYHWQRDLGTSMSSFLVPDGPEAGLRLDLLYSLAGIEAEVARRAVREEVLPGVEAMVATLGDLIALKLLAAGEPGREHDWRDLRGLVARADREDLEAARSAIRLLGSRGRASASELEARLADLLRDAV